MRRRMAEQPRVVIAQVVLVAALVLGGAAVGRHLAVDGDEVPPATTKALERARSAGATGATGGSARDMPPMPMYSGPRLTLARETRP